MSNTTWKRTERRTAQRLGGERVGATGKSTPDVVTPWLTVECKHRTALPRWLVDALSKVRRQAYPSRLGVVVLHEAGRHDSIVCLSLSDFVDWFGGKEQTVPTDLDDARLR